MDCVSYTENQMEGIKEMKALNQEYLRGGQGSRAVREFLTEVEHDEPFLLRFLKGRKYRPKYAWETVKQYAIVRFDSYPEVFISKFPKAVLPLIENHIVGILKARDSKGRLIMYFNGKEWDTERYNMELLTITAVFVAERLLLNEECMENGIVYIKECLDMGMSHVRQYSLPNMLRILNLFWYAFPLKVKEVYMMNVPYLYSIPYGMIKPFFPRKLKKRMVLTSSGKKFEALHERISPEILPKCLGGNLENHEACDKEILSF